MLCSSAAICWFNSALCVAPYIVILNKLHLPLCVKLLKLLYYLINRCEATLSPLLAIMAICLLYHKMFKFSIFMLVFADI